MSQFLWTVYVCGELYDLVTDHDVTVLVRAFEHYFLGCIYVKYETGVVEIEF